MHILLTGAAGFTGQGIAQVLGPQHEVRGLDLANAGAFIHDMQTGDVADLDVCRHAVAGMDAIVLCHMARNPDGYRTPAPAFDANVKGTANLYFAAVEHGIKRCVLLSTADVIDQARCPAPRPGEGPYRYEGELYGLTKILQEGISRYYHDKHGIATAIFRPAWIIQDGTFMTKYGWQMDHYEPTLIDPRDIGHAIATALELPDLGLEAFQLGQDDCGLDLTAARKRLGWQPRYRFEKLPRKPASSEAPTR